MDVKKPDEVPGPDKSTDKNPDKIFFIRAERHDKDRVELQMGFDGRMESSQKFKYDVDLLMFFPKSWGMTEVDFKDLLTEDMQSYVRLHTQASNPKDVASHDRVLSRLQGLQNELTQNGVRNFAADFLSFLNAEAQRSTKLLRTLARKGSANTNAIPEITDRTLRDYRLLRQFRELLKNRNLNSPQDRGPSNNPVFEELIYLNQYVSHLYIQGVGQILELARRIKEAEQLVFLLEELIQEEHQIRLQFGLHLEKVTDQEDEPNEDYLFRIGLLKKYFQRDLFLTSHRENMENLLVYPVYALAAAIAASWALIIQQWTTINYVVSARQLLPTAIVVTAIFGYIVKDIMKDYLRRRLLKAGFRWLPLFERRLTMTRGKSEIKVGVLKEYVRIYATQDLPQDLKEARYSGDDLASLQREVGEDILHFKKEVGLDLGAINQGDQFPWGLREIVRLRLNRMQNSTDDAYKSIHFLSEDGKLIKKAAHRVYHVHICAWVRRHPPKWSRNKQDDWVAFKAFRITLDKNDILSCTNLKWRKSRGIPTLP